VPDVAATVAAAVLAAVVATTLPPVPAARLLEAAAAPPPCPVVVPLPLVTATLPLQLARITNIDASAISDQKRRFMGCPLCRWRAASYTGAGASGRTVRDERGAALRQWSAGVPPASWGQ
jgi:hypothetical protein